MEVLIIPFKGNFEIPIDDKILELVVEDAEDVRRILLKHVIKGNAYHVQIFKSLQDLFHVIIGPNEVTAYYGDDIDNEIQLESYEEAVTLILDYSSSNGTQLLKDIIHKKQVKKEELEKARFESWKKQYKIQQEEDKKTYRKRSIIVWAAIVLISLVIYLAWTDELRFVGRETNTTEALVVKTKFYHWGRGYYKQKVVYQFKYRDKTYEGSFNAGKRIGIQEEGNLVKIKFRTSDPNVSKRIPWR